MPVDPAEMPSNSITRKREEVEKEVASIFPWMSFLERQVTVEVRTLESLDHNQLSIEFLTNLLRFKEKYWREEAIKDLTDYEGGQQAEMSFKIWSEVQDALKGARGEGPVSATSDYFRDQASDQRKTVEMIKRKLSGREPIAPPPNFVLLEHINNMLLSIPRFEKAAENYDTAARLFENQIKFKESATKTPPTV